MPIEERMSSAVSEECRTLWDGTPCLLGRDRRGEWNCAVCRSIIGWRARGYSAVFVQETPTRGGYVFPATETPENCVLRMDFADTSDREIRETVNNLLMGLNEVSIYDESTGGRMNLVWAGQGRGGPKPTAESDECHVRFSI